MASEDSTTLRSGLVRQLVDRLEATTNRQLFGFSVLWVLVGGLLLQLVVLPHIFSSGHWGHGLIGDLDSVGFHLRAADQAQTIRQFGWGVFDATDDFPVALTTFLYAAVYPEPWVVLPVNAILFGIAVVAVRRLLTILFNSAHVALLALAPFFVFPSFAPLWGQLHRDLITGAGLCVVLCALVLAGKRGPGSTSLLGCVVMAVLGMGLMWLSRSYAMTLIAGATVMFALFAVLGRACPRGRLFVVVAVVLLAASSSVGISTRPRGPIASLMPTPPGGGPSSGGAPSSDGASSRPEAPARQAETPIGEPSALSLSWRSLLRPRIRYKDPSLPLYASCLPDPTRNVVDRLLFNLCHVREGFIVDGSHFGAGSGYDLDVRLRSAEDFIAYGPRAIRWGILEPGPTRWGMEKQSTVGRLGALFVPLEMSAVYVTLLLALVLGGSWRTRPAIWSVLAFCITYALIYAVATPILGTLYRMRAFAFAIMVSIALAIVLANKAGVGKGAKA